MKYKFEKLILHLDLCDDCKAKLIMQLVSMKI